MYGKDDRSPEELGQQDVAKLQSGTLIDVKMNNCFAAPDGAPSHRKRADEIPQPAAPAASSTINFLIGSAKAETWNSRIRGFVARIKADPGPGGQQSAA
jgi:hypothetical protein